MLPSVVRRVPEEVRIHRYRVRLDGALRRGRLVTYVRKLTKQEVPDGSLLLWTSDNHFPIANVAAHKLMIECAEREGVTGVVLGGDNLDLHCLSNHPKEKKRIIEHATIQQEVASARWFLEWAATRPAWWILGNHEGRFDRFMEREENLALDGTAANSFEQMFNVPKGIEVLPVGSDLRLGNLNMTHGDGEFKKSSGGKYPAQKLLDMVPDFSSICGHLHRLSSARRSGRDGDGVSFTRAAFVMPHMSIESEHYQYMSKHPNWQTGFGLIRAWWDGPRARFTVYQIEVMFDRRGRPYFEYGGRLYS